MADEWSHRRAHQQASAAYGRKEVLCPDVEADCNPPVLAGVTPRLMSRIWLDFPSCAEEVASLLQLAESGTQNRERVLAAVVFGAGADEDVLRHLIELSRVDWRDVLVSGGLANADWPKRLNRVLGK